MTTIVTDRKLRVMAADKQTTYGGFKTRSSDKITRLINSAGEVALVATAGNAETGVAFDTWFCEKYSGIQSRRPYPRARPGFAALVFYEDGTLFLYQNQGYPVEIKDRFFGIGSGSEYALGALHAGADIRKAVQIASKLDDGSGGGIQVEGFVRA